jgi:hypothetical protein
MASVTGNMRIVNTGQSSYLFVPAEATNGARLISLHDPVSGIVFRNNTVALPIYHGSEIAAGLVLATEDMMAGREGFFGRIAGAELDIPIDPVSVTGNDFSAQASIFLRNLPPGIAFRAGTGSTTEAAGAINTALLPSGLMALEVPLVVGVSGADSLSESSIEFMIITMNADPAWVQKYGGNNITLCLLKNGTAVPQQYRAVKAEGDQIALEAVSPVMGTFALAAAGKDPEGIDFSSSGLQDVLVFGGLLALLISVLIIMVRRIAKR